MRALLALLLMLAALPSTVAAAEHNFVRVDPPKALPHVRFADGEGRDRTLADFKGKVVLLNVWATWCVPCRKELPALDRLQSALGSADFQVIALSVDRKGLDVVRKFYDEIGVKHLGTHLDSSGKAARELGAVGLPTTLLIDRAGREIGRLVGPAEWDTPEMIAFIRRHIDQQ